jgi:TPR repeat protein
LKKCFFMAVLASVVTLVAVWNVALARNEPAFYPGGHGQLPMVSGPGLVDAMRKIATAGNDDDLKAALAVVRKMVDGGDAEAAFRLGRYYHLESAHPDYAMALELYKKAMEKGHAWATNNIGLLFRAGSGVPRDFGRAREYFERAMAKNDPNAFYNLALMSFLGQGVPKSNAAGLTWLDKGVAQNLPLCLYEEAAIFYSGAYGVPVDLGKAMMFGTHASDLGDREATWGIAKMYIVGEGVPENIAKGMEMLRTLSEKGFAKATDSLGELYADGKIRNVFFDGGFDGEDKVPVEFAKAIPTDPAKSLAYWQISAQQSFCRSMLNLSSFYDRGIGVPLDYTKGAQYVAAAAKCAPSNSYNLWKLGKRFYDAKGVPRDCAAAAKLFLQSMMLGHSESAVDLGYIYDKGCDSIPRDDRQAFEVYLFGAKAGVPLCQNNVGAMLKHGRGVGGTPDPVRGYAWLKLAASNGDELALKNLTGYDYLFTDEVRKQGLEHLEVIKKMILKSGDDRRAVMGDMTY